MSGSWGLHFWENPFPCNLTGDHVSAGTSVPYPLRGNTQGCVAEYLQVQVSALIYTPLTLTVLLTDLTRLQRSLGLMTLTRAGFMTRDPRGKDVVGIPQVGETIERHTGGLILHVLTERPPDVLKRPKILFSRFIYIN